MISFLVILMGKKALQNLTILYNDFLTAGIVFNPCTKVDNQSEINYLQ